jgi:PadR family transcriptional regulator, regulatory protein AphA
METKAYERSPRGLELALLGLLRRHPSHAYELHQALQRTETLGLVWRLKQSHLYALLAKLEAAGYIASTLEPQGNRPPRKMLHLTDAGSEVLRQWLHTPVAHGRDFRLEFLAKLSFAVGDGEQAVTALIRAQQTASRTRVVDLQRQVSAVAAEHAFQRLVLQFRLSQLEAILAWLEQCEQVLTQQASS